MNAYNIEIDKLFECTLLEVVHIAGIKLNDVKCTRKREYVEIRQAVMVFANTEFELSLSESGTIFGKDHATVLFAKKGIMGDMKMTQKYPNIKPTKRLQLYKRLVEIKKRNEPDAQTLLLRETYSKKNKHYSAKWN